MILSVNPGINLIQYMSRHWTRFATVKGNPVKHPAAVLLILLAANRGKAAAMPARSICTDAKKVNLYERYSSTASPDKKQLSPALMSFGNHQVMTPSGS
jgi:hypothetical protein